MMGACGADDDANCFYFDNWSEKRVLKWPLTEQVGFEGLIRGGPALHNGRTSYVIWMGSSASGREAVDMTLLPSQNATPLLKWLKCGCCFGVQRPRLADRYA